MSIVIMDTGIDVTHPALLPITPLTPWTANSACALIERGIDRASLLPA